MQEPFNVCRMLKNKITDRVYLLNKNISVTLEYFFYRLIIKGFGRSTRF